MTYQTIAEELELAGWTLVYTYGSQSQFRNPAYTELVTVPCYEERELSIGVIANIQKVTGLSFER